MKQFRDRVAVVTGAGSGIGRAVACELARRGSDLAISDISEKGLEETVRLVEQLGRKVTTHLVDVADRARMESFAAEVVKMHGRANIVVNNAGVVVMSKFEEQTVEDLEWIVNINLWGVLYGCKFFLPHLKRETEAHIVNISSMAGFIPIPNMSSYVLTKFAVRGFTETLRIELRKSKIGVTCVHPGAVATNIPAATRYKSANAEKLKAQGKKAVGMIGVSPEKTARLIVDGIARNSARVVIGSDARFMEALKRVAPVSSSQLIGAIWPDLTG